MNCPYCVEEIHENTYKCPHCNETIKQNLEKTENSETKKEMHWLLKKFLIILGIFILGAIIGFSTPSKAEQIGRFSGNIIGFYILGSILVWIFTLGVKNKNSPKSKSLKRAAYFIAFILMLGSLFGPPAEKSGNSNNSNTNMEQVK